MPKDEAVEKALSLPSEMKTTRQVMEELYDLAHSEGVRGEREGNLKIVREYRIPDNVINNGVVLLSYDEVMKCAQDDMVSAIQKGG